MSNVIELLERLGKCGNDRESIQAAVGEAEREGTVSSDLLAAIEAGDHAQLSMKLGARTNVYCAVFPAKQDEEEQEDDAPDDDKESPDDKKATGYAQGKYRVAIAS